MMNAGKKRYPLRCFAGLDNHKICGHTVIVIGLYIQRGDCVKCFECRKEIDILADVCPFCGEVQFDDEQDVEMLHMKPFQKEKKTKKGILPVFSEEECFIMGIHPDDELYRKTMELNILSKNYKH